MKKEHYGTSHADAVNTEQNKTLQDVFDSNLAQRTRDTDGFNAREFHRKHYRTQVDQRGDEVSLATAINFTGVKDMCRQEFKDDADINILARRFNLDELKKPITWGGEVDFTTDLQQSLTAITESRQAYNRLHPDIRDKYPTWEQFTEAMATGELAKELEKFGLKNVSIQQVREIDDELARTERREQRLRDREADQVAQQIRTGQKPKEPEEKTKK